MASRTAPTSIDAELQQLAGVSDPDLPVVTLYLDARGQDQHQREALRTFVRRSLVEARRGWRGAAPAGASLEADLTRMERHVEALTARGGPARPPGIVLFACAGRDLFVELRAPVPFRNQFAVARGPRLAQLSILADEYESALVALVDAASARIFASTLGGVLSEMDLTSDVPGRHKQGGWAQARYQRHIRAHRAEHHKGVAAVLAEGLNGEGFRHVILGGPQVARLDVRRRLPPGLEPRIIGEVDLPLRAGLPRVEAAVREVLQAWERRHEAATVQALLDRAGNPAQAAVGVTNSVAAVNRRAVHLLLVAEGFGASGWVCTGCGDLEAARLPACSRCGGTMGPEDLREGLVAAVLRAGGGVEWVTSQPALERLGGVGALLRPPKSH